MIKIKRNLIDWAVVSKIEKTDDGVKVEYYQVVARFDYPNLAEDFINKCLPEENRDRFQIIHMDDIREE